ncbi:hypothetical protein ACIPF8_21080 [Collimonas sp. NPDC087041]|uniref:hypothetical protein n=1 Tax=Collimonas sp. NPDC087041 TaxID=3363960 RepID=UPI00382DEFF2
MDTSEIMKRVIQYNFGYLVVRLPAFVSEFAGDTLHTISDSQGRDISYFGLDRNPWRDFDDLFYSEQLAEKYKSIRQKIIGSKLNSFSPGVCYEIQEAKEILELSNKALIRNELIMITAESDISKSGEQDNVLGFDCYVDGYGSLLRLGLFQRGDIFNDFLPYLNTNGMFNSSEQISKYVEAYLQRYAEGGLEPIDAAQSDIDMYLVSRVISDPV